MLKKLVVICLLLNSCTQNEDVQNIEIINTFAHVDLARIDDPSTLVLFDVDETLIQPLDAYFFHVGTPKDKQFRRNLISNHPEIHDWDHLTGIALRDSKRPLIEPMVLEHIKTMQEKRVPVIAITAMNTGPYWPYARMEKWRYEHLESLGFKGSFQDSIFPLEGFKKKPVFYKGVLATDLEPKGPVLGAWLDHMELHPNSVVMFDDSLDFLQSVQRECQKRNIPFKGYQYKGATPKPWDQKLIEFQGDYLLEHKKWLDDETAKKLMAS